MAVVLRSKDDRLPDMFADWVSRHLDENTRIILVSGLEGSGKSTLSKTLTPEHQHFDLDDYLVKPCDSQTPWIDHIINSSAKSDIIDALKRNNKVVLEGVDSWRFWNCIHPEVDGHQIFRVYVKQLAEDGRWTQGEYLSHFIEEGTPYLNSVRQYTLDQKPWEIADLVLERLASD